MLHKFVLEYYFEEVEPDEAEEFFDGLVDAIIEYTESRGKHCTGTSEYEQDEAQEVVEDEQAVVCEV